MPVRDSESIIRQYIEYIENISNAFESVKDAQSARQAAGVIDLNCDQLSRLTEGSEKSLSIADTTEEFIAEYLGYLSVLICQIEKTVNHAIELSEGDETFASSLQSLSGIGSALKQLQLDGK